MRAIKSFIVAVVVCNVLYGHSATIKYNAVFDKDTTVIPLNYTKPVYGLSAKLKFTSVSEHFMSRVVLEDNTGKQYLIAEAYREIMDNTKRDFNNFSEETVFLNGIIPSSLKIYTKGAVIELYSVDMLYDKHRMNESELQISKIINRKQQIDTKIASINKYNNEHGKLWTAGVTKLSLMDYDDKMRILGCTPLDDTYGFEYYVGGILEIGEPDENNHSSQYLSRDTYVDKFDWTDRHGQNWMTTVKNQGNSNYCVAFASLACVEALTNLYYNMHINLDLSEQEAACCGTAIYSLEQNWNPYNDKLNLYWVKNYLKDVGVCDEYSYPFYDDSIHVACISDQILPLYTVKVHSYTDARVTPPDQWIEDSVKHRLIEHGPLLSGIHFQKSTTHSDHNYAHAMALVGYGTIHAGDSIREIITSNDNDSTTMTSHYTIPDDSPLIGSTYFKFKNSYGLQCDDDVDGYMYVYFHNFYFMNKPSTFNYPFTITNCRTSQPLLTDDDIVYTDADGDGLYFWGLGDRPNNCPSWIPETADGDDSDINYGSIDSCGFLNPLPAGITIKTPMTYSTNSSTSYRLGIVNGGVLTVTGTTTLTGEAKIRVCEGGILIVDGGTIQNADIVMVPGSQLIVRNNGKIYMASGKEFEVPKGAYVNIESGEII